MWEKRYYYHDSNKIEHVLTAPFSTLYRILFPMMHVIIK